MNFLFSTWAWALPCLILLIALPVLWYVMARFALMPGLHQLAVTGNQDFTCGLADGEDNRPSQSTPARPGPRDDPIGVGSAAGTAALPGRHGGPLGTAALPVPGIVIHDEYAFYVDAPALGKSPEQICYEAYRGESRGYRPAWDCLPVSEQMAWKAAAEAVAAHLIGGIERADDVTEAGRAGREDFTTEAQRGTEGHDQHGGPLGTAALPGAGYCAGPDDPVIPPHHTGHEDRV